MLLFPVIFIAVFGLYFFRAQSGQMGATLMRPSEFPDSHQSPSSRGFENEVGARLAWGRAGIDALQTRTISIQANLDRWSAERDDATAIRQRLLQSLRQADYEGRWPTKAEGRYVDRGALQEMIRRTDQWMQQYAVAASEAQSKEAKINIAAGVADQLLLRMQRLQEDARDGDQDPSYQDSMPERRSTLKQLAAQLDSIFRDKSLYPEGRQLSPISIDASGR